MAEGRLLRAAMDKWRQRQRTATYETVGYIALTSPGYNLDSIRDVFIQVSLG